MKNKIEWSAWVNPYTKDSGKEFVNEQEGEKIFAGSKYRDSYEEKEDEHEENKKDFRLMIPSPIGAIPVTIYHNFTEYQLWRANTNFIIDDDVKEIINTTLGVERFTIYTPYTFIVGFGKLFDSAEVKVVIQRRLNAMPPIKGEINPSELKLDKPTKVKLELLKSQMNTKYWSILVLPNEEMELCMTEDIDEYEVKMKLFSEVQEVTGAIIFTNDK